MKFSETFVGRAKELTVNKSRLESLLVGTPFVTSVVGDAGIGKTKYCAVVMQMATDFGITVVRSVSSDHGGVGSYWLWRSVFLQLGIPNPFDFDRDIALLSDPVLRSKQELLVFEEIIQRIRGASRKKPILIVLEDLHWADEGSLRLLSEFVSNLVDASLGVVVTYREQFEAHSDGAKRALMNLNRVSESETIRLEPFTELETLEVVKAGLEIADQESVTEKSTDVFKRSGGNPLFVAELVQTLKSGESSRLSATVQMVIDERILALDPETVEVLEICSLSSVGIERSIIELVAESESTTLDDIDRAIDEGVRRQLIFQRRDVNGMFEFRHPIVREVIESRIGTRRRSQIHARYLKVLKAKYRNPLQEHSEELVFHADRARPLVKNVEVASYLILAAREAMNSLSVKKTANHYTRVIELSESGVIDGSLAEAMRGIVVAGSGAGRDSEIARYFEQTFRYYVREGMIDLALEVAQIRFIDTEGMSGGIPVYESALELVDSGSRIDANIMGRLARSVGMILGDYPRAHQ
jgi:predicted ATPase